MSLDLLKRTVAETDRIVQGLSDDQLAIQTPCVDWKVRDLINHITEGATMFAISAGGSAPADDTGGDLKRAWRTAADSALAAFEQPGVMEKIVTLPFGEMPGAIALNIAVFDVATHAVDLASCTGQAIVDEDLLETALAVGKQMIGPELRQPGVFDAEQPCADDAPVTQRLLAFAGRKV
jgi:uncharacterized protein (TIGR03086 family)